MTRPGNIRSRRKLNRIVIEIVAKKEKILLTKRKTFVRM